MRNLLLLSILVGSYCLFSQDPPAGKGKDLSTIQGRTVNSVTGEPVPDVRLTLRALPPGTDSQNLSSDAEGRFSFEDMEPGSYVLSANRPGSLNEVYGARSRGASGIPLTLSAGQILKDIEFKLSPLGVISGKVVDEEDKPVRGARVAASATDGSLRGFGAATTDAAGEFRVPGLGPGSYVLRATPAREPETKTVPSSAPKPVKLAEHLLPTYFPSAPDAAAAVPLEVAPGVELSGITIVLRKGRLDDPRFHVRGTIVPWSPAASLAGVSLGLEPRAQTHVAIGGNVMVVSFGSGNPGGAAPARDGSFDLGDVRPGSYFLTATQKTGAQATLGRVRVDISSADVAGVVLRIGEPLKILGTMKMEGQDESDLAGVGLELRLLDGPLIKAHRTTLSAERGFSLEEVAPDKHQLLVSGLPEGAYVKSIRVGGQETIGSVLDLTDMQAVVRLDILVSPNGATVEGVANDGDNPAPGAWIALVPDPLGPESASRQQSVTAGGNGKFVFRGLAPGEYRLYAFQEAQLLGFVDPDLFSPYQSKSTKLTVRQGERKSADLTVLKTEGKR